MNIFGNFIIGILMIVGAVGFTKRKVWAWKLFMWLSWCIIFMNMVNVIVHHLYGNLTSGYFQNACWFMFYGVAGLYFLNHSKIKDRFK